MPLASDLPNFLQRALKCFKNQEMLESLGEDPLQDRAAQGLGEFLIASSLSMAKVQDLQAEISKLSEESTLQAKAFSQ